VCIHFDRPTKKNLVGALHGRRSWPSSSSINDGMTSSWERKGREGKKSRGRELPCSMERRKGVHGGKLQEDSGPAVSCCIM
jgi:hypothetical protein